MADDKEKTVEQMPEERLFDKLFNMTEEAFQKSKIGLVEQKVKRKLEEAFDDAEARKIDAEESVLNMMKDLSTFDVNSIIRERQRITACNQVQEEIHKIFEDMFNDKLNR